MFCSVLLKTQREMMFFERYVGKLPYCCKIVVRKLLGSEPLFLDLILLFEDGIWMKTFIMLKSIIFLRKNYFFLLCSNWSAKNIKRNRSIRWWAPRWPSIRFQALTIRIQRLWESDRNEDVITVNVFFALKWNKVKSFWSNKKQSRIPNVPYDMGIQKLQWCT